MTRIVLVKHAQPVLDAGKPAREWTLGEAGLAQAERLGSALATFAPFRLASSPEPKARATCAIVSRAHGVPFATVDDLREIDRPVLPILSRDEHERLNERLFIDADRPVLGAESARHARERFGRAVRELVDRSDVESLVVVTHGTVISLFVAQHSPVNAFDLWRRLQCGSYVVLDPAFRLREVVETTQGDS